MKYILLVGAILFLSSCSSTNDEAQASLDKYDKMMFDSMDSSRWEALSPEEQGFPLYIYEEDKTPEATLTGAVKYELLKMRFSRDVFNPDAMQYEKDYSYQVVEWPYYKYRVTFDSGSVGYYYNQPHVDWPTELLIDDENTKNIKK